MNDKHLKDIADNIGWMSVFVFIIMLSTCTGNNRPKVNVTVDACDVKTEYVE